METYRKVIPSPSLSWAFHCLPCSVALASGESEVSEGEKMMDKRGDGPGMGCMLCFYSTRGSMYVKDPEQAKLSL